MSQSIDRMPPLSRARLTVAVALGVYPLITGLLYLLWPVIAPWPLWQKTLAVVPLMAPAMVWGVIPAIHRYLRPWLHPVRCP